MDNPGTETHVAEPREFFVHLRVGNGAATLSCKLRGGGDLVDCGVALCAPTDHFSRKLGRAIASGRRVALAKSSRQHLRAFAFKLPGTASSEGLRDQAMAAFCDWLRTDSNRPWWTIDAQEPRVELWSARA